MHWLAALSFVSLTLLPWALQCESVSNECRDLVALFLSSMTHHFLGRCHMCRGCRARVMLAMGWWSVQKGTFMKACAVAHKLDTKWNVTSPVWNELCVLPRVWDFDGSCRCKKTCCGSLIISSIFPMEHNSAWSMPNMQAANLAVLSWCPNSILAQRLKFGWRSSHSSPSNSGYRKYCVSQHLSVKNSFAFFLLILIRFFMTCLGCTSTMDKWIVD